MEIYSFFATKANENFSNNKSVSKETNGGFSDVLAVASNNKENGVERKDVLKRDTSEKKVCSDESYGNKVEKYINKSTSKECVKDEVSDTLKFAQGISDTCNEIRENIKDILDIDDETLNEIMETLNISNIQLFNQNTVQQIILSANGSNSISDVLIDEKLAQDITEMMDFYNQKIPILEEKLGISIKELNDLVQSTVSNMSMEEIQDVNSQIDNVVNFNDYENLLENENIEGISEDYTNNSEYLQSMRDDIDNNTKKETKENIVDDYDNGKNLLNNKVENNDILHESGYNNMNDTENSDMDLEKNIEKDNKKEELKNGDIVLKRDFMQRLDDVQGLNLDELAKEVVYERQLRDIVSQVAQKVRLEISADKTELEMQLNPENLGKMVLKVTERNGNMVANISVENEIAKEALEMGLKILKDNLQEQGVKVSAIEVTVENSNLDNRQSDSQNAFEYEKNNSKKGKGKKNKIDVADAIEEVDKIAGQVMIDGVLENVSSISYTA